MPTFNLHGLTFAYIEGTNTDAPEDTRSWEYGKYPHVLIRLKLMGGGVTQVYGEANRWSNTAILASWLDSHGTPHWTWLPKQDVTPVTESEWDIERYRNADEFGRRIVWGERMPGMLPW